jgi:hypothetical protein
MIVENAKHLIIGFGVLFWFKGMYRILDIYIGDTITNNTILVILSLCIFLYFDGSLEKIGSRTVQQPYDRKKTQ